MTLVSATFAASLKARQTGPSDFDAGGEFTPSIDHVIQLVAGVGANQADILWPDERIVLDGANDDIDLNGALTDAFGQPVAAAELVGLIIINAPKSGSANTTNLTVGGATNAVPNVSSGPLPPGRHDAPRRRGCRRLGHHRRGRLR